MSGSAPNRIKVIGLTGGVAAGKNFVAEIFSKNGAVIFDADKEVHKLLELDQSTIDAVKKNFPESFVEKKIDRKILGKIVFSDVKQLKILEKILHPQVRASCQKFLRKASEDKKEMAVLNIPLLLETGHYKCDYIIAVSAPISIRKQRFLARSKSANVKIFNQICAKQISDTEREKKAAFVINNGGSKGDVSRRVKAIITELRKPRKVWK
ncbi:MAG: dephospho-CoA kinase [Proteobacteria bacterium]|nr:dephospho-CoA kinase [Pseudomonadota bacterium]